MEDTPYLQVVGMPREMGGAGAPKPTVFGVLGHTQYDPLSRTLGGLVSSTRTSGGPVPKHKSIYSNTVKGMKTERNIAGKTGKTHIPGVHHGQVPYAGKYMSDVGKMVSS